MTDKKPGGVYVPALTPFKADLSPDTDAFVAHCRWLLDQGADGLAAFGTTSEATSLSGAERMELLDALVDGGIDASVLMPGTGTCSITETAEITAHAVGRGCGGVLMLPPFYYKGMSDDGLFAHFSEVIQKVGSSALNIYLYHIPPVAQVGISLGLIERLIKEYPDTVVGLKDSSGDWDNTKAVLDAFPGFRVFPGSEVFLLDGLRNGGVGCITATGNVNPAGIRKVYENWQTPEADVLQARITEIRKTIQAYPMVPALKVLSSLCHDNDGFSTVRPPMVALSDDHKTGLLADLEAIGFDMAKGADNVTA